MTEKESDTVLTRGARFNSGQRSGVELWRSYRGIKFFALFTFDDIRAEKRQRAALPKMIGNLNDTVADRTPADRVSGGCITIRWSSPPECVPGSSGAGASRLESFAVADAGRLLNYLLYRPQKAANGFWAS